MRNDIAEFKNMLTKYKSTISIALDDTNLYVLLLNSLWTKLMLYSHKAAVTADVLKEYKELIINTTSDLQDHLQDINQRL